MNKAELLRIQDRYLVLLGEKSKGLRPYTGVGGEHKKLLRKIAWWRNEFKKRLKQIAKEEKLQTVGLLTSLRLEALNAAFLETSKTGKSAEIKRLKQRVEKIQALKREEKISV